MNTYSCTSRRNFLKTSLLGGASALAAWHLPKDCAAAGEPAAAPATAGKFTSRVSA